ncbi:3'(2'),5'-bisphosphate nucleotidase CysQ [uncultured Croceitalea sp.]|uniref:3'(2'),5'-bisphosphate nucleotidase CysQ n=1 Tax=uncultured Croceitalea sp. TaxID=1798908 RepID=UPI003306478F
MNHSELLKLAIKASISAGAKILEIYKNDNFGFQSKDDESPLTIADITSNNAIMSYLNTTNIPIISEENKEIAYADRKDWNECWIVDPLDGTKEFIKKNGEFTVNIALCTFGKPTLGVIYVPVTREIYYAEVNNNVAYKSILDQDHSITKELFSEEDRIAPSLLDKYLITVVGSRSHMNKNTLDYIDSVKPNFENVDIVSKGSSLKFCLVAEGKADVYPRFAPTMEWDTAAGQAICNAVGLNVISQETKEELNYNKENLLNPFFLVRK